MEKLLRASSLGIPFKNRRKAYEFVHLRNPCHLVIPSFKFNLLRGKKNLIVLRYVSGARFLISHAVDLFPASCNCIRRLRCTCLPKYGVRVFSASASFHFRCPVTSGRGTHFFICSICLFLLLKSLQSLYYPPFSFLFPIPIATYFKILIFIFNSIYNTFLPF